jgi:hypothetical protein
LAPGCLICESEERETWTAESLRAVCAWIATYESISNSHAARLDETSAVHVSGQHQGFARAVLIEAAKVVGMGKRVRK